MAFATAIEEAGNAQVLIEIWPVDTMAFPYPPELASLLWGSVQQLGKPGERDGDPATISERYYQLVFVDCEIAATRFIGG